MKNCGNDTSAYELYTLEEAEDELKKRRDRRIRCRIHKIADVAAKAAAVAALTAISVYCTFSEGDIAAGIFTAILAIIAVLYDKNEFDD